MRIVLSGGGTAGHINPALAVAEILQERGHEILFAGCPEAIEERTVKEAGIPFKAFEMSGFNRNHPLTLVRALKLATKSTKAATKWFSEIKPDVVVGFGGYVCIPVGRAAKNLHIPLVIHEQNSVMGMANAYLAKSAQKVAVTYEVSASSLSDRNKVVLTGNPVRKCVLEATQGEGRSFLKIPENAEVLLIFGGSLGARHINDAIVALKERLLVHENLYLVHITGSKELDRVKESLKLSKEEASRWLLFGYQDHMGEVLAAATVVLARAGATSLAEISARRIPALLVPFPFATKDHQTTNAKAYVERGAAYMIADAELESDAFSSLLFDLVESLELRQNMQRAAASFDTEDAATKLADVILAAAN